ncbi:MAG: hypothetical protein KC912_13730 [Proteobacteria bacterium]|nr:hypothetical protein [Pseudomonadota bacterium]
MTSTDPQPTPRVPTVTKKTDKPAEKKPLPPMPKPDRDCCQSGCYGCEWADAMRERCEL